MKISIEKLFEILRCPLCNRELLTENANIMCVSCKSIFSNQNGKVFFTKPPQDLFLPRESIEVLDKKQWSSWCKSNYEYLSKKLKGVKSKSIILDIGAGRSPFRDLMTEHEVVSLDFYPHELIDVVNDLTKPLPFSKDAFDVVIIANVLEHVPDMSEVIREGFRVLKPGGMILAITPFMMGIHEAPYEFNRPTSFLIQRELINAGFHESEIQHVSNFYNAYLNIQSDFFNASINANPMPFSMMFRLWRKTQDIFLRLFRNRLEKAYDINYPAGYAFSASKPV